MIKDDSFSSVKQVVVVGGKVDSTGLISHDVKVCEVVQVGEYDLMVKDNSAYTARLVVVSKSVCIPISFDAASLTGTTTVVPEIGDLIMTVQRQKWQDKSPTQTVGILYEIVYELGSPVSLIVLVDNEMRKVKNENILVLQTAKNLQKKSDICAKKPQNIV